MKGSGSGASRSWLRWPSKERRVFREESKWALEGQCSWFLSNMAENLARPTDRRTFGRIKRLEQGSSGCSSKGSLLMKSI